MNADFIGAGWAFPVTTDATGGIALVTREREIGCRIHDHVFGPANSATAGQIAYDVREALERWEPRIEVRDVSVSYDRIEAGVLYVDVGYVILGSNDPRNLVFPFYVIPEHSEYAAGAAAATVPVEAGV